MGDKLFSSDGITAEGISVISAPFAGSPRGHTRTRPHFTKKYAAKMDRTIDKIPSETMPLGSWRGPGTCGSWKLRGAVVILSAAQSACAAGGAARRRMDSNGASTLEEVDGSHPARAGETRGVISAAANRLACPGHLERDDEELGISRGDR